MSDEKKKCCGSVWPTGAYRSQQCAKNGKFVRDGKHYCKTHDPVSIKEKNNARNDAYEVAYERRCNLRNEVEQKRAEEKRKVEMFDALLDALKDAYPHIANYEVRCSIGVLIAKAIGAKS